MIIRVARLSGLLFALLVPAVASAQAPAETIEYYGTDAVGSIRIVWDTNGNVLGRQDYAPFGKALFPIPAMPKEEFVANEQDAETDQGDFHARMFEARTGRFTRPDPIQAGMVEPQRWNRYAYGLNNPVAFRDPAGLQADAAVGSCGSSAYTTSVTLDGGDEFIEYHAASVCPPSGGFMAFVGMVLDMSFGAVPVGGDEIVPTPRPRGFSPGVQAAVAAVAVVATVVSPVAKASAGEALAAAAEGAAAGETQVVLQEGTVLNRVWDSRWTQNSQYSGPEGGSFTPGAWLPINAEAAITDRGLNLEGIMNNAQTGALYITTGAVPATLRTSLEGTELEIVVAPQYQRLIQMLANTVSNIPHGGG